MKTTRRTFIQSATAATLVAAPYVRAKSSPPRLGQGEYQYRVVPDWGQLGDDTPVKNGHGIVTDREGHLILLTDHTKNNVIVYDKAGALVHKWGTRFPGAHGLSIVTERNREVLYITDLAKNLVVKTSLDGQVLNQWFWPEENGKYTKASQYKPSWTLHLPGGGFFVLDGYGRDYIMQYDAAGNLIKTFGGREGGIKHWGPHGGMVDLSSEPEAASLLIAMSDQQEILRLSLSGEILGKTHMPGGNPRQIRKHKDRYFVAHLADNWPADRGSRGFISVLNEHLQVISNVAGTPPVIREDGTLEKMAHREKVFMHPHDLVVDEEESLYVAQFDSGNTYPIKLERV